MAYLKKKDQMVQAKLLQELPTNFQIFLNDWSCWEHLSSDFKTITLKNGCRKCFNRSVWLGLDHDPKDLLSSVYLLLNKVIPHGGGKVEFSYKDLQAVDIKQDLILFGVPADVNTSAFKQMFLPFLKMAMSNMNAKKNKKCLYKTYGGNVPNFVVLFDWLFNAPSQEKTEIEGIPFWCKKCIQLKS